ncbi:AI-2E family transporter [Corynebacterium sp. HS2168-gen11]|uniref:AI-2E family transporter n=1 Tax=Corynebacterium sp. HS2168-gen11 TaxID=2974027 RepID=UPI00216ABE66|nr:AI-2E family transporter [Corynebacterium sp. HS2168-gen11]MCS4534959.1 AI-2E family transporter [Corynebacterium sp. HS2168-gen11]
MSEHNHAPAVSEEAAEVFEQLQPDVEDLENIDRAEIIADGIRALASWSLRLLLIAAAAFMGWYVLSQVWRGILPVAFALIICTVLWPPVAAMRRIGFPKGLASFAAVLGALGSMGFVLWVITPNIAGQSQTLYYQAIEAVQRLQLWLQGPPFNLDSEQLADRVNAAAQWIQQQGGAIASEIFTGLGVATSVVVTGGIVAVLTFFFLKDGDNFLPWLRGVVGKRAGWHLTELLTRAWRTLSGYIRAQAIVSLADAVFIGIGLIILGVPMAFALAVLTFIAGFIPIVGAFVAGTLSVMIALVSLGVTKAIATLILVLLVQQIEGNILSPLLHSRAMNLHPVIVLISITIGGSLFGIIGAFLAVPTAAMIAVLLRYIHDMIALRSGEKTAADIEFATAAGSLTGQWGEAMGKKLLEDRRAQAQLSMSGEDKHALLDIINVAPKTVAKVFKKTKH